MHSMHSLYTVRTLYMTVSTRGVEGMTAPGNRPLTQVPAVVQNEVAARALPRRVLMCVGGADGWTDGRALS